MVNLAIVIAGLAIEMAMVGMGAYVFDNGARGGTNSMAYRKGN